MNFPFYIAKRYSVSFSKSTAINIITAIASLSIIVSTMALFVVMSGFSGLRELSLSFTNQMDPELKIFPKSGKVLNLNTEVKNKLRESKIFSAYSEVVEERVLFSFNGKQQVAYIKGVDSNFVHIVNLSDKLYSGQWIQPNSYQAVAGYVIADKLGLGLFDYENNLEVLAPKPGKGTIDSREAFNQEVLIPVGIYAISEELDQKYIFTDIKMARELLNLKPNAVSALEFKLAQGYTEAEAVAFLNTLFNQTVDVKNRAQLNESLYRMLNTENLAVYLIFTLVIILALFNLVGALIMMVLEKLPNLKTLFNLGAEIKDLRKIFFYQGLLVTFIGACIGLVLGIILVVLQQQFELVMISSSLPYPTKFEFKNIVIVLITVICFGSISSLIASSRVTKNLIKE